MKIIAFLIRVLLIITLIELTYIFFILGIIEFTTSEVTDVWLAIVTGIIVGLIIIFCKDEKSIEEWAQVRKLDYRRKISENHIKKHNQDLIDTFIKPWSESKPVDEHNLHAIEHLQSGYPDVWKLRPDKVLLNHILEDRKSIKEILNKEFGGLPDSFECKRTSDNEKIRVYNLLEDFFQKDELPEDSTIINSDEFVEAILNHTILYDKMESLNKNEDIGDEKSMEFEQGLAEIVFGVEEQHKELRGICKVCKDWHEELKYQK